MRRNIDEGRPHPPGAKCGTCGEPFQPGMDYNQQSCTSCRIALSNVSACICSNPDCLQEDTCDPGSYCFNCGREMVKL